MSSSHIVRNHHNFYIETVSRMLHKLQKSRRQTQALTTMPANWWALRGACLKNPTYGFLEFMRP
jgi:hypothetical protein